MQENRHQRGEGGRRSLSHCLPSSARPLYSLSLPLACVVFTLAAVQQVLFKPLNVTHTAQLCRVSTPIQFVHASTLGQASCGWEMRPLPGVWAGRKSWAFLPPCSGQGRCVNPAECRSPVTSGLGTNAKLTPFPVTPGSHSMLLWLFSGQIDSGGKRSISASEPIGEQSTPTVSLCHDTSLQA